MFLLGLTDKDFNIEVKLTTIPIHFHSEHLNLFAINLMKRAVYVPTYTKDVKHTPSGPKYNPTHLMKDLHKHFMFRIFL